MPMARSAPMSTPGPVSNCDCRLKLVVDVNLDQRQFSTLWRVDHRTIDHDVGLVECYLAVVSGSEDFFFRLQNARGRAGVPGHGAYLPDGSVIRIGVLGTSGNRGEGMTLPCLKLVMW